MKTRCIYYTLTVFSRLSKQKTLINRVTVAKSVILKCDAFQDSAICNINETLLLLNHRRELIYNIIHHSSRSIPSKNRI